LNSEKLPEPSSPRCTEGASAGRRCGGGAIVNVSSIGAYHTAPPAKRSMRERHRQLTNGEIRNQTGALVLSGVATVIAPTEKIKRLQAHVPELHLFDPQARFGSLIERVRGLAPVRCAVVHPCDQESLKGALDAAAHHLIIPVLIAPAAKLRALALGAGVSLDGVEIIDVAHSHAAAEMGAAMAGAGEVEILMKGSLHTDEMMHAVFATRSLRTKRRMSHVFRLDVPMYDKVLLVSDAALNIQPPCWKRLTSCKTPSTWRMCWATQSRRWRSCPRWKP
jgi:hypothetical protein